MALDFVKDWAIAQTLGEGAYGEVKLLVNKQNGEMVAMKIIDLSKNPQVKNSVSKEVTIHKMLQDIHIIRFFGRRQNGNLEYIFLEYAPNGELFDRIEPDVGMSQWEAQKYMRQLISGVEYLHGRGVAHRDLKPENLLIDQHDNLKITDFGMATIFRVNGKERLLDKRCGTLPYVAPEVLSRPYVAEPADIWSCGIVLVAMLAGELPWDKAEADCNDYMSWRTDRYIGTSPWCKVDNLALSILKKILCHVPSIRYTIQHIKLHPWLNKTFSKTDRSYRDGDSKERMQSERTLFQNAESYSEVDGGKRKRSKLSKEDECGGGPCGLSQPATLQVLQQLNSSSTPCKNPINSFSQPVQMTDMLISTQQLENTQSLTQQNSWQKLVRRMTRFLVDLSVSDALEELTLALQELKLTWKVNAPGCVTINTVDRRKSLLMFKANIFEMDKHTLLDFRLSKGCGLEFKRHFISIKSYLSKYIVSASVVSWPVPVVTSVSS